MNIKRFIYYIINKLFVKYSIQIQIYKLINKQYSIFVMANIIYTKKQQIKFKKIHIL